MAIIQDWKIRSTQARCELTGEPFVDGQEFFTCIFEDPESDGFLRRDYSAESWKQVRPSLQPAPYSFWKSTFKAPLPREEGKPEGAEDSIEGMLRRFIEEDDPATENTRYILALMLERNKTLIQVDSKETETRSLLFYEHADNGDVFIVADPGLRLDEIETVQREVAELLAAEEKRQASERGALDKELHDQAEGDESQAQEEGDGTAETEEESVALADEEAAHPFVADARVEAGGEFADQVYDELEKTEGGENGSSPDHELEAEAGI